MHGNRGSRPPVRRYLCSGRRHSHGCEQPITKAEPLENQPAGWLRALRPDADLRAVVLDRTTEQARQESSGPNRKAELDQLRRLQELFVLGDLTKAQYIMRRQAVQDELERPRRSAAHGGRERARRLRELLDREKSPAERHRLLTTLFEQVWQDD